MKKQQRFKKTKYSGIREDVTNGTFEARKQINGKPYREVFKTIRDATDWKKNYNPHLTFIDTKELETERQNVSSPTTIVHRLNGVDYGYSVRDAWNFYTEAHISTLEKSSQDDRTKFKTSFLNDLMNFKMVEINSLLLDKFIKNEKKKSLRNKKSRRKNFDNDLKILRAFFNWYRENLDERFIDPVLKRHKALGLIKKGQASKKKMSLKQFELFLTGFSSLFWKDVAETHFFFSGRIQEAAGVQVKSVHFGQQKVEIVDVVVWGEDKRFSYLKNIPKNGEERWTHMNNRLNEIFQRRINDRPERPFEYFNEETGERLDFVFHINGEPVTYRQCQYHYNKALKKVGLDKEFSSTHFLRKAMAKATRDSLGLDAAQAVGGWKSREVVEDIYTDVPMELTIEASQTIEKLLYGDNSTPLSSTPNEGKGKLRLIG